MMVTTPAVNNRWGGYTAKVFFILLLLSLSVFHFAGRIHLVTADLGRHLKNGQLFFSGHLVLTNNFYSFTSPDYPAICHHWLTGVVFYWIYERVNFFGLGLFYVGLLLLTLLLVFSAAARASRFFWAGAAAILVLPLLGYRTEIRPEGLSTFFLAVFYLILNEYRSRRLNGLWLLIIPALQVLWVNAHILFFLGLFLTGAFTFDMFLKEGASARAKTLLIVCGLTLAASLLNPFGLSGLIEPFNIFKAYGYDLAENQTVFFMIKRFPQEARYTFFLMVFVLGFVALAWRAYISRDKRDLFLPALIYLMFGLMAAKTVRAIAMFGFMFIPLFAENMQAVAQTWSPAVRSWLERWVMRVNFGLVFLGLVCPYFYLSALTKFMPFVPADKAQVRTSYFYTLTHPDIWAGLVTGVNGSAEFWHSSGMKGPIFNNYDVGGYLIFNLYPREKVFVDNRPEAYSVDFFRKLYVPMQEDESVWKAADTKYGFQAIYFFRRDITPWAQPFLIRRIADPDWAPVFVDDHCIILAKRNGVNQGVVSRFELPQNMFRQVR